MSLDFDAVCRRHRLVPVAVVDDPAQAPSLGRSLAAGGLPIIEVTLRTPAGLAAIAALARDGAALVGAGTVLEVDQVDQAVAAGASFIVSPGHSPEVVERCLGLGVPVLPGVATPSEAMAAREQGVRLVKLFPAAQLGGPAGVAAFATVFRDLGFVPTGGVGPDTLGEYLAMPAVAAVGGSWMAPRRAIVAGDFALVTELTRKAVADVATITGARAQNGK